MVRNHLRFAIFDVTFAGQSLPGATVDQWVDERGQTQWIARVVTRHAPTIDEGVLRGRTARGEEISGVIGAINRHGAPSGRGETLCELQGSGELTGLGEPAKPG